jgi:outer membrane protein assembly factor BamB
MGALSTFQGNITLNTLRFFAKSLACAAVLCVLVACEESLVQGQNDAPLSPAPSAAATVPDGVDWPQWRGVSYDGIAPAGDFDPLSLKGLDNPLTSGSSRLVWKAKIAKGYAGVAVAGEFVYTMGFERTSGRQGKDIVYCLKEKTGEVVWTYEYPGTAATYTGPRAFPLVRGGFVYTISWDGILNCLDAATGRVAWTEDIKAQYGLMPREQEFGFCAPPVIQGNILLLNAREYGVALDKRTGAPIWQSPAAMSGYASPVPFTRNGRNLAAMFGAAKLYVVETETGRLVGAGAWPTKYEGNIADPIVLGDDILVSSTYEQGYGLFRLSDAGLSLVYRQKGLGAQMSAGVAINGYYYGNDFWYYYRRGEYRCIEIATGRTMWAKKQGMGAVIAVGDTLLLLNEYGRLAAAPANPSSYSEIASCQLGPNRKGQWFTPPTFARSRLYVRNYDGDVFCLDLSKR